MHACALEYFSVMYNHMQGDGMIAYDAEKGAVCLYADFRNASTRCGATLRTGQCGVWQRLTHTRASCPVAKLLQSPWNITRKT